MDGEIRKSARVGDRVELEGMQAFVGVCKATARGVGRFVVEEIDVVLYADIWIIGVVRGKVEGGSLGICFVFCG